MAGVLMHEEWRVIEEFPDYAVSSYGRVRNLVTDLIKTPTQNQQGTASVLLMRDHDQYRRSVSVLVASAFVEREQYNHNTPIHLDGDLTNHHPDNLRWRPRWFALKYHKQFKPGYFPAINEPIEDVVTKRQYRNSLEASMEHGLLDVEIFLAIVNRTVVFPTNQRFQLVNW
jgi:hypothetical protein